MKNFMRTLFFPVLLVGVFAILPGRSDAQSGRKGAAATPVVEATLAQLMKGTMFPDSNVIFFAQSEKPQDVPKAKDPSTATDPLTNVYGGWEAVENSSLAIAEAASLLSLPGRKCSNGRAVPVSDPDWNRFVQGLRNAGMKAYKAAQSKDQDKILDAADTLTTACGSCHEKYRDKKNVADRCM